MEMDSRCGSDGTKSTVIDLRVESICLVVRGILGEDYRKVERSQFYLLSPRNLLLLVTAQKAVSVVLRDGDTDLPRAECPVRGVPERKVST